MTKKFIAGFEPGAIVSSQPWDGWGWKRRRRCSTDEYFVWWLGCLTKTYKYKDIFNFPVLKDIPETFGQFDSVDVVPLANFSIVDLNTDELAETQQSVSQKPKGSESISTTSILFLNPLEDAESVSDLVINSHTGKDKPKTKKKKSKVD